MHYRCGDFLDANFKGITGGHHLLSFRYFSRFIKNATWGLSDIVLMGNRELHAAKPEFAKTCRMLFHELKDYLAKVTGATIHVAPEADGRVAIARDTRCLSQSKVLVIGSTTSTFAYWQTLLHDGCVSYQPFFNNSRLFSQHRLHDRQQFVLAEKDRDLVDVRSAASLGAILAQITDTT
ncbi:MAG: hypothetical protein AAF960_11165 [Bacteroidota bacterium]